MSHNSKYYCKMIKGSTKKGCKGLSDFGFTAAPEKKLKLTIDVIDVSASSSSQSTPPLSSSQSPPHTTVHFI